MVEVVGEPRFYRTAGKALADGIVLDQRTGQHHCTGEYGGEADTHLVEDNPGKDEEEDKYVQEGF